MAKAKDIAEMYTEEVTPASEVKGFTKSFVKRTKEKKTEDVNVKELLNFAKENKVIIGAKSVEKNLKNSKALKVFTASNCDDLTLRKVRHYARLASVEVVVLDLDNSELAQKMGKPFYISMVCIAKEA